MLLCVLVSAALTAGEAAPVTLDRSAIAALAAAGERWLLAQQKPNGSFLGGRRYGLGISALAIDALASAPTALTGDDPRLRRATDFILTYRRDDGGFYDPREGLVVYGTGLSLIALAACGRDRDLVDVVRAGRDFLFARQNREAGDPCRGGIGSGDDSGPGYEDLHNTAYAIEALRAAGVPASDPRMHELAGFVARCQNRALPASASPPRAWVTGDGGGIYSPSDRNVGGHYGGEAAPTTGAAPVPANQEEDAEPPRLVSYGSMTYALLASYVALDLQPGDARLVAAFDWIRAHYRVDGNAGMPAGRELDGLYYYQQVLARTFHISGTTTLTLADGRRVDWRTDLATAIAARAEPVRLANGEVSMRWRNRSPAWGEGEPVLATAYAVRALKRILATP